MTPKEKAIELVDNYQFILTDKTFGKDCALVAVDEIITTLNYDIRDIDVRGSVLLDLINYWQEVKQEIQAL
jgi:hypothetical protein